MNLQDLLAPRAGIAAFSLLLAASCVHSPPPAPDFSSALNTHLAAITSRDLDGFTATLTDRPDLRVIFPNGELVGTTQEVIAFHKEWFADDQWVMEPVVETVIEGSDMSAALIRYDYRDTPDGTPRSTWLILIFQLENGEWRLVHDQNTRIAG
jgi:hypothetical protein